MDTKDLILVRGVSGSGKTTLANTIARGIFPVYSADNYFMVGDEYKFDATRLRDAHADCNSKTEISMINGVATIIVANTFTREWEMSSYVDLAEKHGYIVHSIIVENRHGGANVHDVPDHALTAQKDRFEVKL